VIAWLLDLKLPAQSVPITTKVVNSNPARGEVYSIQPSVIKFVSDLRQVGGFIFNNSKDLFKLKYTTYPLDREIISSSQQ
jgi:hypothetical protein